MSLVSGSGGGAISSSSRRRVRCYVALPLKYNYNTIRLLRVRVYGFSDRVEYGSTSRIYRRGFNDITNVIRFIQSRLGMRVNPTNNNFIEIRYNGRTDAARCIYRNTHITTQGLDFVGPIHGDQFPIRYGAIYIIHGIQLVNPNRDVYLEMSITRSM